MTASLVLNMLIYSTAFLNAGVETHGPEIATRRLLISTNRPIRNQQDLVLTVGQTEGDLQGKDDKVIQAGVEYLNRMGGGTLQ